MLRRLALVLLLVPLAGCLKFKDATELSKDGSGTIESSYVVQLDKMRDLLASASMLLGQGDPEKIGKLPFAEMPNLVAPARLRAQAKACEGYEITEADEKLEGATRTTTVKARFDSLKAAARGGAFVTSSVSLSKVEKSEAVPNGAWKLVFRDALSGGGQADAMGGVDIGHVLPMFEAQIKDLDVGRSLTVPTKILATNGKASEDGRSVSWSISYQRILERTDLEMSVTFEAAENLELEAFTHEPDVMELMRRASRPQKPAPEKPATTPSGEGGKDADGSAGSEAPEGKQPDEQPAEAKPPEETKPAEKPAEKQDEPPQDEPAKGDG